MWLQKPWGFTACLYHDKDFEFWDCHVLAGGFSSLHHHEAKHNRIYSRSAVLRCLDGDREVWIAPGQYHDFIAGRWHRFEVMQSGAMYETYWPIVGGVCNPQDIVRKDTNGWRPPSIRTPSPRRLEPVRPAAESAVA